MFVRKSHWIRCIYFWFMGLQSAHALPDLSTSDPAQTAGYFQLSWDEKLPPVGVLQQASQVDFESDLREWAIAESASFSMSGLADGEYFYRFRSPYGTDPAFSSTLNVTVQHHSLGRSWLFFGVGALIFFYLSYYIFLFRKQQSVDSG